MAGGNLMHKPQQSISYVFHKKHSIDKKQKKTAVGAVCRKLTYQIYRIMKYDEGFDMEKAAYVSM